MIRGKAFDLKVVRVTIRRRQASMPGFAYEPGAAERIIAMLGPREKYAKGGAYIDRMYQCILQEEGSYWQDSDGDIRETPEYVDSDNVVFMQ